MKKILFLTLVSLSVHVFAQKGVNLESLIPNSASAVLRLNGKQLTRKVSIKNIAKSQAFLKMIEGEIFLGNDNKRITDIGINLEKDVFMIYQVKKNIVYTAYLYHIEKPKLFGRYIAEKNEFVETVKTDDYTVIHYKSGDSYYDENRDFLAWNKQYAVYFDVSYVSDYKEIEVAEDAVETIQEDVIEYEEEYDLAVPPPPAVESVEEEAYEEMEVEEEVVYDVEPAAPQPRTAEYYKEREEERLRRQRYNDSIREVERLQKQAVIRELYDVELNEFFGSSAGTHSITNNDDYKQKKNEKADISFWMSMGRGGYFLSDAVYGRRGYYRRRYDPLGILTSYMSMYAGKDWSAHLFFNQEDITIKSNMAFTPELSNLLSGIYGTSIPKSYLKYISNEKVLGIASASLNAEKFWEAFPRVYSEALVFGSYRYGGPDEKEYEGIKVLVDFISIMLDEKALAKLATGNTVFVLKDLVPTEVEYYTYEYNEDYTESKRVKKTKTEIFPDFLLMFGSENKDFMVKLLELACKNEVLYRNGNYYYSDGKSRDLPFALYFTVTDDMAFVSTNLNEIQNLADGKTVGNLDKKMAANVLKNSGYFNLNLTELLNRIPDDQLSNRELKMMNYFRENGGVIESVNNFENGASLANIKMLTPSQFSNSALFIWDLIETAEQF